MVELVVIWATGEKEYYLYNTEELAERMMRHFKTIFGDQIEWMGIREKR